MKRLFILSLIFCLFAAGTAFAVESPGPGAPAPASAAGQTSQFRTVLPPL